MPQYNMKNKATGEVHVVVLSLNEREQWLQSGEWEQLLSTPRLVSHTGSVLAKTDDGWKETLNKVKSGSGRGNTIKT